MRRPISRVRSVTDTSMMFMMPTPPTTSEIRATPSSRFVMTVVVPVSICMNSAELRMWKSSSSPGLIRWRSRSSVVTSSIASSTFSGEVAMSWIISM